MRESEGRELQTRGEQMPSFPGKAFSPGGNGVQLQPPGGVKAARELPRVEQLHPSLHFEFGEDTPLICSAAVRTRGPSKDVCKEGC